MSNAPNTSPQTLKIYFRTDYGKNWNIKIGEEGVWRECGIDPKTKIMEARNEIKAADLTAVSGYSTSLHSLYCNPIEELANEKASAERELSNYKFYSQKLEVILKERSFQNES